MLPCFKFVEDVAIVSCISYGYNAGLSIHQLLEIVNRSVQIRLEMGLHPGG